MLNMHALNTNEDLNEELDVFGQQPGLSIYTQICLCFPLADTSSHSAIINTLTNGLERLSESFPWVAGKIVNERSGEGQPGTFKIRSMETLPRLVVKDLSQDPSIPAMDDFRRAKFPFRMLDESVIAPLMTLGINPNESAEDRARVFLLQATFITGGLLLTFLGHHQAMDMTGQGRVMHLFSKACHNEQFTIEELTSGNPDRRNIIPLLDDSYVSGPELEHQIVKTPPPIESISSGTGEVQPPLPLPICSWAYFTFSPTSLAALKKLATETITLRSGYISTDDTLSAFIRQSVSRARLPRLDRTASVTFARAIDPRRYLGIPQTYPGLVQNMAYTTYPHEQLVEGPLGGVASQLRLAVDPKTSDQGYKTRALATVLSRAKDKNVVSVTASLDLAKDIMLSSWAKEDCYGLDFNLGLGMPEAVRRPQFTPVESLMYLMPKRLDGEIAAAICLREEDMERLEKDEMWAKYAEYVG